MREVRSTGAFPRPYFPGLEGTTGRNALTGDVTFARLHARALQAGLRHLDRELAVVPVGARLDGRLIAQHVIRAVLLDNPAEGIGILVDVDDRKAAGIF